MAGATYTLDNFFGGDHRIRPKDYHTLPSSHKKERHAFQIAQGCGRLFKHCDFDTDPIFEFLVVHANVFYVQFIVEFYVKIIPNDLVSKFG